MNVLKWIHQTWPLQPPTRVWFGNDGHGELRSYELNSYIVSAPLCTHHTGWYVTFKIWFLQRRAFVCSQCGEVAYHDT